MQTAHCCFNEIMDLFLILLACNNLISALSSLKRPNLINNASSGSKLYQTGLQMLEQQNIEFVPRDEAAFQPQNLFTPAFIWIPLWIKLCFKLKTQTFAAQWFDVMLNKHYRLFVQFRSGQTFKRLLHFSVSVYTNRWRHKQLRYTFNVWTQNSCVLLHYFAFYLWKLNWTH